ncbi:MAG: hypothetical protein KC502_08330 [Myxococcales bacterium]|nr:hypothetical protein [Myxococcales bacterium]
MVDSPIGTPMASATNLADAACPYVGLLPYAESDSSRFFGRDLEITRLVEWHMAERQGLFAVLGPCGSGKSSLLQAGVIPALRARYADAEDGGPLRVHTLVPTKFPLVALADALGSRQPQTDAEAFATSTDQAVHLARVETGHTLLIVDQFEELFALCPIADRQRAFAAALLACARDKEAQTTVIVALRTEFQGLLDRLPQLRDAMGEGTMRLATLTRERLSQVVNRPAEGVGLSYDEGVSERIVDEVLGETSPLPLLQFTLVGLWQKRMGGAISMAALESVGGPGRALELAAARTFKALIPEEANCARRIFSRLVQGGADGEFERRRVLRSELRSIEDPSRVDRVMARFVSARLLSLRPVERDALVEITHEALLRTWPKLVGWIEDGRHVLRQRQQLREALTRWQDGDGHGADLLSPTRMATFSELSDLDADEKRFLQASAAHWELLARKKGRQRQMVAAAVALVAMVGAVGWYSAYRAQEQASSQASKATEQEKIAEKNRTLAQGASGAATAHQQAATDQRNLAKKARRDADLNLAKAVALKQKLEMARAQLRKDLTGSRASDITVVEDAVRLLESALPRTSVLIGLGSGDAAGRVDIDEARRELSDVVGVAGRVRKQVRLLDKTVNSGERRRDKETRADMRAVSFRVDALKRRLKWFDRQAALHKKQLDVAERKMVQPGRKTSPALTALHESLSRERGRMAVMAGKRTKESDAALWADAKKLWTTKKGPERAVIHNIIGLAWYDKGRFDQAAKSFALAWRTAPNGSLRDRYLTNRAWAIYRHALTTPLPARGLKRARKLASEVARRTPRAAALLQRLHDYERRQAQLILQKKTGK